MLTTFQNNKTQGVTKKKLVCLFSYTRRFVYASCVPFPWTEECYIPVHMWYTNKGTFITMSNHILFFLSNMFRPLLWRSSVFLTTRYFLSATSSLVIIHLCIITVYLFYSCYKAHWWWPQEWLQFVDEQ